MSGLKIFGTIVGAVAVGAGAILLAPIVLPALGAAGILGAAGTGTAIATLEGAALVSASTACITGTVAGTTAVIAGTSAAAGAVIGNKVADKIES